MSHQGNPDDPHHSPANSFAHPCHNETAQDLLGVYLRWIRDTPLLAAEEETELFKQIGRGAENAREKLILANLRLVVSICRPFAAAYGGMDFLDLIQEGNISLMAAVENFDWRRGCRFSTYATHFVHGAVCKALTDQAHTIRIPEEARRKPNLAAAEPLSLETPIGEDGDFTLGDSIVDENIVSPFDAVVSQILSEKIAQTLNALAPNEATVLKMRFGLGNSPERARQGSRVHRAKSRACAPNRGENVAQAASPAMELWPAI